MKTVAIITSRWKSTRLPNKALVDIGGKPMLQHIVDNARKSNVDDVVVATTESSQPIIDYCLKHNINVYVGSEEDVLDRLYQTGMDFKADTIVYLWGDCPLIEPLKIDRAIRFFLNSSAEYLTYVTSGGEVIAVFLCKLLEDNWLKIDDPHQREYIHETLRDSVELSTKLTEKLRVKQTVDTKEDLDRVRRIYEKSI